MGRDFSYKIVQEGQDLEKELKNFDDFTDIYQLRNNWLGPSSFGKAFTRDEIIAYLKSFVNDYDYNNEYNFYYDSFGNTLAGFGEIIDLMDTDSKVIIHYC